MKIYTIENGKVQEGATIEKLALKGAGIEIPALVIGEEGRGRERGVLPVQLTDGQYKEWQEKGHVRIDFAEVGTTKVGQPKFFVKDNASIDEKIICVFRTEIGFRGSNSHTGEKSFAPCPHREETISSSYSCEKCGTKRPTEIQGDCFVPWVHPDSGEVSVFAPFPGKILIRGVIAQGDAGRMGSGDQLVAVLPKCVFRTAYSGRLYGAPSAHYYSWDGQRLLGGLTWDERCVSEIF